MPLAKPSKIDSSPLPVFKEDAETGAPVRVVYHGRINGVPAVEKAPKGQYNPDGTKEQVVIVINVLNAPETFKDKKIWAKPEFKLSGSPKAKKLTQLTRLVSAADPNYEIGEEYNTDDLKDKELLFTLADDKEGEDGRIWQKPLDYFPVPANKRKGTSKAKPQTGETIEY